MNRPRSTSIAALAAALLLAVPCSPAGVARAQVPALAPAPGAAKTALDRYVGAPDPSYKYELAATIPGEGYTAFVLDMTSQTWRAPGEVDRTAWKHWLTVITPDKVRHQKAFLYITGGSNNNPAPKAADENLARVAVLTGSVVAELRMVPNQPLTFLDDTQPRSEDGIVAYTWDKFLRGGDDQWPLRLPMTKAAVRAMDAVVSYCASQKVAVDGFVVAGASKRGWTAWTTAAVDRRVVAVVPLVIDLLNIVPSFKHHLAVYGYYAPAVADYEELGIMAWSDSPRYRALMAIEEPYEYRQRLTMPKFMVNATGDQFFVPDSWRFYLDQLSGVTSLRYVPNADHSLRGTDAWLSVLAWYHALLNGAPLPQFTWQIDKDGAVRVRSKDAPSAVTLWQATNPGARDFRLSSIGAKWKGSPLKAGSSGEYVARVPRPFRGYTAYMVELTFPSGVAMAPFTFTTGVKVVPDIEPFKAAPAAVK
ncbi:MAG: PhoPQ-activated pathogenicity-related family protein [Vicinamibacterales bacterium]|jgi:PhoPQ-activated pathogenicity-related protein|nr:PhoPQ-activated pathogenicity-related family protein [Vicinamibacterales bacterium]